MKNRLDDITDLMALGPTPDARDIQRRQTAHRITIADAWQIQPGENILEIGCGQGDLSAVLADQVGPSGHVTGIDIASARLRCATHTRTSVGSSVKRAVSQVG